MNLNILLLCAAFVSFSAAAQSPFANLEQAGKFREADQRFAEAIQNARDDQERKTLAFERDRLHRIRRDYSHTRDTLYAALAKAVKDLTPGEFDQWDREGRFDSRVIDGARRFLGSSVSNLFFRHPDLDPRRQPPRDRREYEQALWENCVAVKQAALAAKHPYVLPQRLNVTMTVTARPDAAPDDAVIRAWLPVPRRFPFQDGFELLSTSSPVQALADADSPIRSVYLEQRALKGKPTRFTIQYNYTTHAIWFQIDPASVLPCDQNDPSLKSFTAEAPHLVFTPKLQQLSQQLAGGETNPFLKAKKFYDWISHNIQYSYAHEYSTLRNISDYCLTQRHGDCGQEALLFMALCRDNGIPARWQSGWYLHPLHKTIHDWCEIYIAPHGWIPVDPFMGINAAQYLTSLSPEQRNDVRNFYFGGLDQHRMAANSDHNQMLFPAKNSFRSDDVDFQRGELEYGDTNLYFDAYSYELTWKRIE